MKQDMDNSEPFAIPLKDLIGATVIRLLDGHKYTIKGLAKPHEESTITTTLGDQLAENKRLHQIEFDHLAENYRITCPPKHQHRLK